MRFVKGSYFRRIAFILVFALFVTGSIPTKSMAAIGEAVSVDRLSSIDSIRRALETRLVAEKLSEAGLDKAEVQSRIDKLSDEELHQFASMTDGLYPGGSAIGVVAALLIIAIIALIALKMADRKIIIK
ncbi:MAG: PA2779 family protein [Deltaproteobacteria bacterium]|nr:PA2779 family protein [Deltaproteobacteria bacterium]